MNLTTTVETGLGGIGRLIERTLEVIEPRKRVAKEKVITKVGDEAQATKYRESINLQMIVAVENLRNCLKNPEDHPEVAIFCANDDIVPRTRWFGKFHG